MPNKFIALRFFAKLLLALYFLNPVCASEKSLSEDTLKALYSYKFALFTEWPETKLSESNASFEFCIIGRNPFGQAALENLQDKPVKEKSLHIEVFSSGVLSDESLHNCHVAYISGSETQRLPAILSTLARLPILTISDIASFSSQGGMITLIKQDEHIEFQINPKAIKDAGLAMSSKIIELATLVKTASR